jgi:integrase
VRNYAPRWVAAQRVRLSPRTVELYGHLVRRYLLPAFGNRPLAWLRRDDIRAFLAACLARLQPRTVETIAGCLSSMLSAAVDDGLLLHNPAHGATRHLFPRREPEPKALLPAELARLLTEASRGKHHDAFLVMARTGLRVGECLALEAASVDRAGRAVRVTATWHSRERRLGPPKGGRSRVVDLSRQALAVLEARIPGARPFLFAGPTGAPYSRDALGKAFRRAAVAAGLPAYLTPHCLRHTYASTLLGIGAPVQYVQAQLGHASIEVTVAVYGSWLRQPRHDLVDLLDDHPLAPGGGRHGVLGVDLGGLARRPVGRPRGPSGGSAPPSGAGGSPRT